MYDCLSDDLVANDPSCVPLGQKEYLYQLTVGCLAVLGGIPPIHHKFSYVRLQRMRNGLDSFDGGFLLDDNLSGQMQILDCSSFEIVDLSENHCSISDEVQFSTSYQFCIHSFGISLSPFSDFSPYLILPREKRTKKLCSHLYSHLCTSLQHRNIFCECGRDTV